jgi:hypothetical protein
MASNEEQARTRCYWAILDTGMTFQYLDPLFQQHMKEVRISMHPDISNFPHCFPSLVTPLREHNKHKAIAALVEKQSDRIKAATARTRQGQSRILKGGDLAVNLSIHLVCPSWLCLHYDSFPHSSPPLTRYPLIGSPALLCSASAASPNCPLFSRSCYLATSGQYK